MTPLQFEQLYEAEWLELELTLERHAAAPSARSISGARVHGAISSHLRAPRDRAVAIVSSPPHRSARTHHRECHQLIYQQREFGLAWLARIIAHDFPVAVRAHAGYVTTATLLFLVPTFVMGALVYAQPELILSVVDAETAAEFDTDVLVIRRRDRTVPDGRHRLDDVRPLHPEQHRRRLSVLRRRLVCRARIDILSRLQRRVRRRDCRLPDRARTGVDVLFVHRRRMPHSS